MLAYKGDLVSDLVSLYNKTMSQLLDKHAPLWQKHHNSPASRIVHIGNGAREQKEKAWVDL